MADDERFSGAPGADLAGLRRAWRGMGHRLRREGGAPVRPAPDDRSRRATAAFRDEAAVDFPSMERLVDGIRASFLGADADTAATHTTRVALSARQAHRGADVPLSIDVRHTCPLCGGRGELPEARCGVCRGAGSGVLPQQLRLRVPPGVRDGMRLRFSVTAPWAAEARVEVRIAVG